MRIIDITQALIHHGLVNYYCTNPCICHLYDDFYLLVYRTMYYHLPVVAHPWNRWWSDIRLFEKYHPKYSTAIVTEPIQKVQRKSVLKNVQSSAQKQLDIHIEPFVPQQNKLFQVSKIRKNLGPDYTVPLTEGGNKQSAVDFNILDYDGTSFAIIQIDKNRNVNILRSTNNLFQYEMNQDCRIHREDDHFVLTYNGFINNDICMLQRLLYLSPKFDSVYISCESYCNENFMGGVEKNWTMFKDNYYIYSMCDGIKMIKRNNTYNSDSIENQKYLETGIIVKQQEFDIDDVKIEATSQDQQKLIRRVTSKIFDQGDVQIESDEPDQKVSINAEQSETKQEVDQKVDQKTKQQEINSPQGEQNHSDLTLDGDAIGNATQIETGDSDKSESLDANEPTQLEKVNKDDLARFDQYYPVPEIDDIVAFYGGKDNIFFSLGTPCIPYKDGYVTVGHIKLNHLNRITGSNFDIFFKRYFEGQGSKNLHKHGKFVYFMFLARFNNQGILTHISNGFIPSQGSQHLPYYLVFAMGIVFNAGTFFISFGEGDVRSKLVAFTEREFTHLLVPIDEIKPFNYEFKMLSSVPQKRILVLGYYGSHNTGDDCFSYIFDGLNKPECSYTVKNPYKIQYIPNFVDLVIVGGGDVLNPYFMDRIKELMQTRPTVPAIAFSVGIPYPAVINREFLSVFKKIVLRNPLDVPFVKKYHDNVSYLPDMVYVLPKFVTNPPRFVLDKSYTNIGVYLTRTIYRNRYENDYVNLLQKFALLFNNLLKHYNSTSEITNTGTTSQSGTMPNMPDMDSFQLGAPAIGANVSTFAKFRTLRSGLAVKNTYLSQPVDPMHVGLSKVCVLHPIDSPLQQPTSASFKGFGTPGSKIKTQDVRAECKPIRLYFIPMGVAQHNSKENDIVIQRHLANIMKPLYNIANRQWTNDVIFLDQLMDIEEMVEKNNYAYIPTFNHLVSQMDHAICMRFHAHICSIMHKIPITSMATTRKCEQLMKSVGLESNVLQMKLAKDFNPIDFDVDLFTEAICEHINNRFATKSKMNSNWEKMQAEISKLEEYIAGEPMRNSKEGSFTIRDGKQKEYLDTLMH